MPTKLVAYWQDGGDGGGSIRLYNTLDELKTDKFNLDEWTSVAECERKFQSALEGDNPYEDGEISDVTLELTIQPDGTVRLSKSLYLHYG